MNLNFDLLTFMGSPFLQDVVSNIDFSHDRKSKMFELAKRNKIGLFYLKKLKDYDELSGLENFYDSGIEQYKETIKTALNLCSVLDEKTDNYAIFKFMKPFIHTPSDVDVIFFLEKDEFFMLIKHLIKSGYQKIAESPSQTVLYDLRGGIEQMDTRSVGGKKGGKYYIDLYSEVSASHVIYANKATLRKYRISTKIEGGSIKTIHPIADLCVVLAHSIVPERLLTMADYYTTLFYLKTMNDKQISEVVNIFKENRLTYAGWYSIGIIANIHNSVHRFIPEKIRYLQESLGSKDKDNKIKINSTLPFRYDSRVLLRTLTEIMKDEKGFQSIIKQVISIADPRLASWIIYNWILRKTRETY